MSADAHDHAQVIAWPPLILAGWAAAAGGAHHWWPVALLPVVPARIIGAALAGAAGAQAAWAAWAMRRAGTNIHPTHPTTVIVVAGPYRYTRNPMYLSLCLLHLGGAFLLNGALPVLFVLPLALTLHFGAIRREERYLAAKFGATYLAYQSAVRRWL